MNEREPEIKICGLTRPEESEYLNEYSVDYAGFVFYEKSKRNISFERADEIMKNLDAGIKRVAVTVSPDVRTVNKIMEHGFDILQIHRELGEEVIREAGIPIWYAINIEDEDNICVKLSFNAYMTGKYVNKIEGILLDAPVFGSGKPFDWKKSKRLLKAGDRSSPFYGRSLILAGGLNSENVLEGIKIFEPDVVDVSSGVEGDNGKSREKIKEFVNAVRWQK